MNEIVSSWGDNSNGQLGNGTSLGRLVPDVVKGLEGVATVEAGSGHAFALLADGTAYGWGRNGFGQTGIGTTEPQNVPAQVKLDGIKAIAPGGGHTLFLREDGTVWGCGAGFFGMLGPDNTRVHPVPVPIETPGGIVQIVSGGSQGLALLADGTVWSWGRDDRGQLGDGAESGKRPGAVTQSWAGKDFLVRFVPAQVHGVSDGTFVAAGGGHSLVVRADGTLVTWGFNDRGQLGDGTTIDRNSPVRAAVTGVRSVAAAYHHTTVLLTDGTVRAFGMNDRGQLGDGTTKDSTAVVTVRGLDNVVALAATGGGGDEDPGEAGHNLALRADGTVWAWGSNDHGELGLGHTAAQLVPVRVPGLSGVRCVTVAGEVPGFREDPGGGSALAVHVEQ
ncbi:MAG: hypothetical protein LC635_00165 [Pseudonocardiaceae bacterium]|nr:hypothetical protein [Pseudonocardiaceae bacterium]